MNLAPNADKSILCISQPIFNALSPVERELALALETIGKVKISNDGGEQQ